MTTVSEEPHWVNEDGMGQSAGGYWRQFLITSDGHGVIGKGATREQAKEDAKRNHQQYEEFTHLPPEEQLRILLDKGELLHRDMNRAIKLIGELVLARRT